MKKTSILKRFTYGFMALAIALCSVLFCGTQNGITANDNAQASAEEVLTEVTVIFPSFSIISAVIPPDNMFTTNMRGGAFNVEYNLSVVTVPNMVNYTDKSTFALSFNANLYNISQDRTTVIKDILPLDINNTVGVAPYTTLSTYFMNNNLQYVPYPFGDPYHRSFFKCINGGIFSQSMYRYEFRYNQYISNIDFLDTYTYDIAYNDRNNSYLPYFDYLYSSEPYFNWTMVDQMRRVELALPQMNTLIFDNRYIDFNNLTVIDFTYNEFGTFYRFVFPSFSFNNATTVSTYYFDKNYYGDSYELGYRNGYQNGKTDTSKTAFDEGYALGSKDGEKKGYNDALEDKTNSWNGLFYGVVNAPVTVFSSLFNFEIFGVNILSFVSGLLTVALLVAIVRFIL